MLLRNASWGGSDLGALQVRHAGPLSQDRQCRGLAAPAGTAGGAAVRPDVGSSFCHAEPTSASAPRGSPPERALEWTPGQAVPRGPCFSCGLTVELGALAAGFWVPTGATPAVTLQIHPWRASLEPKARPARSPCAQTPRAPRAPACATARA